MAATMAVVKNIGAMSIEKFDAELSEIERTCLTGKKARARKDRELSGLFYRSGWTQEQLAKHLKKSRSHVGNMLKFSAFLRFAGDPSKFKIPADLTENAFTKEFWPQTKDEGSDARRFVKAARLIEEHSALQLLPRKTTLPAKPAEKIVDAFADGKWHTVETIAKHLGASVEDTRTHIITMKSRGALKCLYESRKYGKTIQFRIVKGAGKELPVSVVLEEIRPILKELDEEGRKNMAHFNPVHVRFLAAKIEKLLEKLAR